MIQAPKLWELVMNRYDLTDFEWSVIEPLLPNKPRGVPRVDDRRVLNGIMWVLRSGVTCRSATGPTRQRWGRSPSRRARPPRRCRSRCSTVADITLYAYTHVAGEEDSTSVNIRPCVPGSTGLRRSRAMFRWRGREYSET